MRLIDADTFFESFPELAIEPYINAPTVDITEEQAIDKLHETGWLPLHDKEMTERPQGEWIKNGADYQCNKCFEWCITNEEHLPIKTNFCPNCGADMRGKKE